MSKMKKLFAMLLTLVMIMGIGTTTMAAPTPKPLNGKEPSNEDTGVVTIQGIDGSPTVTLYQIAKADYDSDGKGLIGYIWADHKDDTEKVYTTTLFGDKTAPTAAEITTVANRILADTSDTNYLAPIDTIANETLNDTTYTCTVAPGAYIAVITGASDGSVYNPVFLTVSYDEDGNIEQGSINLENTEKFYTYGTTAVAKKTTPGIEKEITNGTVEDKKGQDDIHTAGLGSKVDFQITPTMPSYPANANNKTFFVADTMSDGLTFDFATLNVKVNNNVLTRTNAKYTYQGKEYDVVNFNYQSASTDDEPVAVGYNTNNGFNLNFNYETLIYDENGNVYPPFITYSAIVNKEAVVGDEGNPNNATLYYTNTPNSGKDWDDPVNKPDTADGIKEKHDQEIVYTYQLAFLKTGEDDADKDGKPDGLEGAIFGIYDSTGQLIDKVTTNENGYAVSTNVKKGTYTVKELVAPVGYSLNTTPYEIEATWDKATIKDTATVTDFEYTPDANESVDSVQVGWISGGKFYEMDEFENEVENMVFKAYVKKTTTTTTSSETIMTNFEGGGTATLKDNKSIPNTKIVSLPSTGGIGTTIFTIGGCAIMIAAAFFFFVSRRKDA